MIVSDWSLLRVDLRPHVHILATHFKQSTNRRKRMANSVIWSRIQHTQYHYLFLTTISIYLYLIFYLLLKLAHSLFHIVSYMFCMSIRQRQQKQQAIIPTIAVTATVAQDNNNNKKQTKTKRREQTSKTKRMMMVKEKRKQCLY